MDNLGNMNIYSLVGALIMALQTGLWSRELVVHVFARCRDDQAWDDLEFWQTGIIYQVYPRSLMDADGDGTGDLQGECARLL